MKYKPCISGVSSANGEEGKSSVGEGVPPCVANKVHGESRECTPITNNKMHTRTDVVAQCSNVIA